MLSDAFELGNSPNIAFTGLFEIKGPNGETGGNNANAATFAAAANATPANSGTPAVASNSASGGGNSGSGSGGSSSNGGSSSTAANAGQIQGQPGASKSDATKVTVAGVMAVAIGIASAFLC